jgi:chromosomal replication initiation ATPase DnaA
MPSQPDRQRAELVKLLSSLRLRLDEQVEDEYNLETFVPLISFDALAAPNTQIIYGRNGTGKTHLLKAFHQHCRVHFDLNKLLSESYTNPNHICRASNDQSDKAKAFLSREACR